MEEDHGGEGLQRGPTERERGDPVEDTIGLVFMGRVQVDGGQGVLALRVARQSHNGCLCMEKLKLS